MIFIILFIFVKDLNPSMAHVRCLHTQTNQEDSLGTLPVPPHSLPVQFLLLVLRLFTPQKHSVIIRCISAPSFPSTQRPLLPALTNAFTRCGVGALNRLDVFLLLTEIHDSRQSRRVVSSEFSPCPSQSFSPHKASFKLNPLENCCFRCSFQFVNLLLLCLHYELNPFSLTRGLRTPNWSTLIINWQNDN